MHACNADQLNTSECLRQQGCQGNHTMQTLRHLHGATTDVVDVSNPGRDAPFVNNYGVWEDEFTELGLAHTLEHTWPDAVCYFGEGGEVVFLPPSQMACHPATYVL